MLYKNVEIAGLGYKLPPKVVTSAELEERLKPLYDRLGLPVGRLELMSGIRERRFWENGMKPSLAAIEAGKIAIANSGIDRDKFGALFHASVCRDYLEPATASAVHSGLKLPDNTLIFDISNACLGVLDGMVTLANMIELDQIEAGVVVAGEMGETLINTTIEAMLADDSATRQSIKPAFASLTIGSGAAAVVMARKGLAISGHRLIGGVAKCSTSDMDLCKSDVDQGFGANTAPVMQTDSEKLLMAGCALAADTWDDFKGKIGWRNEEINRAFTHQVGVAHRKLLYQSIGLDPSIDYSTLEFLGNVGSVSLPITLALGMESGVINSGDNVALLGIGSGLNCLMLGVEW